MVFKNVSLLKVSLNFCLYESLQCIHVQSVTIMYLSVLYGLSHLGVICIPTPFTVEDLRPSDLLKSTAMIKVYRAWDF